MKIDDALIDNLARLSKLSFEKEDRDEIKLNLGKILGLVEQLQDLDTEGVEPLIYMTDHTNILREDLVRQFISKEEALKNAPAKDSDFIKVPKVISK